MSKKDKASPQMTPRYIKPVLVGLVVANLALLIFNLAYAARHSGNNQAGDGSDQYPLLSKRIFAESQNDILINFTPLRSAIRDYVVKQPKPIGVYFEYLPSGTSIGVNDQMEVKLASLIKVPVVMAVYKEIEEGKLSADTQLTIEGKDLDERFGDLWKRGAGTKLSLAEAVGLTLEESDNTAAAVLNDQLSDGRLENVFDSLDLPKHREGEFVTLSPKNYSSILRSLYLSSYLNRDHSNAILDLLTRTKFNDKIPAGVPAGVQVAHKIGVFNATSEGGEQVYNDCGVVYATNRPYTLCIMALGSEDSARQQMQYLSKMVYGYVTKASR